MTRYTKKDVEAAVSTLAKELGVPLSLEAYSPGDRHGTRYRVYVTGDRPHTLSTKLIAICGAGPAVKVIWTVTDVLRHYKHTQAHPASHATAQLDDIETP